MPTVHRPGLIGEELDHMLDEIQLSFWVDLTEQDIVDAATVGELFDNVVRKMGGFEAPRCLTSCAFFRLRRSLVTVAGLDRHSVRPATQLRKLLVPAVRRRWWRDIETSLRLRLPELRPGRAAVLAHWAIFTLGLLGCVVWITQSISWELQFVIPLAAPVFLWGLFEVAAQLPREFPVETFADLVRCVVTLNQQKLAREAGGSTIDQAWAAFRELLSDASGIASASIARDMRFPEDLGRLQRLT